MQNEIISGIIFDMDGVLILSSTAHEKAYRKAMAPLPVSRFSYHEIAGRRTDEAIRFVLAENGIAYSDSQISSLATSKSRLAREIIAAEKPLATGAVELITVLAEQFPLALASSASKETVELFLDISGLRGKFRSVLHGGDVRRAKPDPEIYQRACAALALPPDHCVVVEDAVSGVAAGRAAGATVWGLPGTSSANELKAAGATLTMNRLEDMYELLGVAAGRF